MRRDIGTVAWKEWRELLRQPGALAGRGGYQLDILIVLLVAIFLDSFPSQWVALAAFLIPGVYAGLFHRAPVSFARERDRGTLEPVLATRIPGQALFLGKALFEIGYACCLGLAALAAGAGLVALDKGAAEAAAIVVEVAPYVAVVGVPAVALLTQTAILVSMRCATTVQAHQRTGVVLVAILMAPVVIAFIPAVLLAYLRGPDRLLDLVVLGGEHLVALGPYVWLSIGVLILVALNALALRTGLVWSKRSRLTII